MRRTLRIPLILLLLGLLLLSLLPATALSAQVEESNPEQIEEDFDAVLETIIANMTVEERVGQLFLVTFVGSDTGPNSDIARLIRDLHIGGVVLTADHENIRNENDTAETVLQLSNDLQTYAFRNRKLCHQQPQGCTGNP